MNENLKETAEGISLCISLSLLTNGILRSDQRASPRALFYSLRDIFESGTDVVEELKEKKKKTLTAYM